MAKEADLLSAVYDELRAVPTAAHSAGEVVTFNEVNGFLLEAITAAQFAASEERALIMDANIVQVIKLAGQVWVTGQPVYWDAANTRFTTTAGALDCTGYVYEAAASAAVTGFIKFDGAPQAGNGLRMRTGNVAALTASELNIDTGLTLISMAVATAKMAAQGAGTNGYLTVDFGADGLLDIYGWDDAGAAASVAGPVCWIALGV